MRTKLILGLCAVVILGVGIFLFVTNKIPSHDEAISLRALVAAGNPTTCTFTNMVNGSQTNGTVYIANGMVRGDFVSQDVRLGTIESHMVVKDGMGYMWTPAIGGRGFKWAIATTTENTNKGIDYNANTDYKCVSWVPDMARFDLPSDALF